MLDQLKSLSQAAEAMTAASRACGESLTPQTIAQLRLAGSRYLDQIDSFADAVQDFEPWPLAGIAHHLDAQRQAVCGMVLYRESEAKDYEAMVRLIAGDLAGAETAYLESRRLTDLVLERGDRADLALRKTRTIAWLMGQEVAA